MGKKNKQSYWGKRLGVSDAQVEELNPALLVHAERVAKGKGDVNELIAALKTEIGGTYGIPFLPTSHVWKHQLVSNGHAEYCLALAVEEDNAEMVKALFDGAKTVAPVVTELDDFDGEDRHITYRGIAELAVQLTAYHQENAYSTSVAELFRSELAYTLTSKGGFETTVTVLADSQSDQSAFIETLIAAVPGEGLDTPEGERVEPRYERAFEKTLKEKNAAKNLAVLLPHISQETLVKKLENFVEQGLKGVGEHLENQCQKAALMFERLVELDKEAAISFFRLAAGDAQPELFITILERLNKLDNKVLSAKERVEFIEDAVLNAVFRTDETAEMVLAVIFDSPTFLPDDELLHDALGYAIEAGSVNGLEYIVQKAQEQTATGEPALITAGAQTVSLEASTNDPSIVNRPFSGYESSEADRNGKTPLTYALGLTEIDGIDQVGVKHIATQMGNLLFAKYGARPVMDLNGDHPIDVATHNLGEVALVESMKEAKRAVERALGESVIEGVGGDLAAIAKTMRVAGYSAKEVTRALLEASTPGAQAQLVEGKAVKSRGGPMPPQRLEATVSF